MLINRIIQPKIEEALFKNKLIVIYGARQVGKTTLIKELQKKFSPALYLNCDEPDIRQALANATSTQLQALAGNHRLIFIDEAQRVTNIGLTLKLFVDNFPEIQVVATGSSSFDLANRIMEPLTGRLFAFYLYPLSIEETLQQYSALETSRLLERRLIYGLYPEIVEEPDHTETRLKTLAQSYAYKDILQFHDIRHPELLEKLLAALALQISNEVSYNELARMLNVNRITVEKYVTVLEQAFIIFRLRPFSNNPRKELGKLRKIYFYDTGIRNALINNFNPLALRADTGAIWENFWISERVKNNHNHGRAIANYFWRSYNHQEIDYVEKTATLLAGFECKWSETKKTKAPTEWRSLYPQAQFTTVTPRNFLTTLP